MSEYTFNVFNPSLQYIRDGFGECLPSWELKGLEFDSEVKIATVSVVGSLSLADEKRLGKIVAMSNGKKSTDWCDGPSGLGPLFITKDTIGMPDFSRTDEWPIVEGVPKSNFVLDPSSAGAYYGKKVRVNSLQMDLAEDFHIHYGGSVLVELFSNLIPAPLMTVVYKDMRDIISRATQKNHVESKGMTGSFNQYTFTLALPPMLYASVGLDACGIPKLNRMVIRIEDNIPYRCFSSSDLSPLSKGRYFVDVFEDLDF